MDSIALESSHPFSLDVMYRVLKKTEWSVNISSGSVIAIDNGSSRVYINFEISPIALEIEPIPEGMYRIYMDHSCGLQLVKDVLALVANTPDIIIDNGFDTILKGNDYVAKCRAHPNWDWRREWMQAHPHQQ